MKISLTNTRKAIDDHYSELLSELFVLAARHPVRKDELKKEIMFLMMEWKAAT